MAYADDSGGPEEMGCFSQKHYTQSDWEKKSYKRNLVETDPHIRIILFRACRPPPFTLVLVS